MSSVALKTWAWPFWRSGLCSRYMQAADDLIKVAKDLRSDLEAFEKAPDPFAALVSTVHNNQEFERFLEHPVDRTVNRV